MVSNTFPPDANPVTGHASSKPPSRPPPAVPLRPADKNPKNNASQLKPADPSAVIPKNRQVPEHLLHNAAATKTATDKKWPSSPPPPPPQVGRQCKPSNPTPVSMNVVHNALKVSEDQTPSISIEQDSKRTGKQDLEKTGIMYALALCKIPRTKINEFGKADCQQIIDELASKRIIPKERQQLTNLTSNIRVILEAHSIKVSKEWHQYLVDLQKELKLSQIELPSLDPKVEAKLTPLLSAMRDPKKGESNDSLAKQKIVSPEILLYGYKGINVDSLSLLTAVNKLLKEPATSIEIKNTLIRFINLWLESNAYTKELKKPEIEKILRDICDLKTADKQLNAGIKDARQKLSTAMDRLKAEQPAASASSKEAPSISTIVQELTTGSLTRPYETYVDQLAEELQIHWMEQISRLDIEELLKNNPGEKESAPLLTRLSAESNNLSLRIAQMILAPETPEGRASLFKFFIDVATTAIKKNDYNTAGMIYFALSKGQISRLEKTTEAAFKDKRVQSNFKNLERLYALEGNRITLRNSLNSISNSAFIPFLPMDLNDKTMLREQLDELGGKANIGKCISFAAILQRFQKNIDFARGAIGKMQHKIDLEEILDKVLPDSIEKELHNLSLKHEPRKTSTL